MDSVTQHKFEYAGFWIRAGAYFLDLIIFLLPLMLLDFALIKLVSSIVGGDHSHMSLASMSEESLTKSITSKNAYVHSVVYVIQCAVFLYIYKRFLTSKWQATPGKRLMNVYVVDILGKKLSSGRAILRTALPILVSIIFTIIMNAKTVDLDKQVSNTDNEFIDTVEVLLPNSYVKYSGSEMSNTEFVNSVTLAISNSYFLYEGGLTIDELIEAYEKEGIFDSTHEAELTRTVLTEFDNLSDEDQLKIQSNMTNWGADGGLDVMMDSIIIILISLIFVVFSFVWYITIVFTKEKTALHDVIAKTRVIKGRP